MELFINDISDFYHNSELYLLNCNKTKIIINHELYTKSKEINNDEEFYKMHRICNYWQMSYPDTFMLYSYINKDKLLNIPLLIDLEFNLFIKELRNINYFKIKYNIINICKNYKYISFTIKIITFINYIPTTNYLYVFCNKINHEYKICICNGNYLDINIFDKLCDNIENNKDFDNICGNGCLFTYINNRFFISTFIIENNTDINYRVVIKLDKISKYYLIKTIKDIKNDIINIIKPNLLFSYTYLY